MTQRCSTCRHWEVIESPDLLDLWGGGVCKQLELCPKRPFWLTSAKFEMTAGNEGQDCSVYEPVKEA